jgi:hypothetical protein
LNGDTLTHSLLGTPLNPSAISGHGKDPEGVSQRQPAFTSVAAVPGGSGYTLPHARHDCQRFPFTLALDIGSRHPNARTCDNCFCFVCEKKAEECPDWRDTHCNARDTPQDRALRAAARSRKAAAEEAAAAGAYTRPLLSST